VIRKRVIGALLASVALALPAVALAVVPARPKAGHWKLSHGGFTVNGGRTAVSGFHLVGTGCSLGKLTVIGSQTLRTTTSDGITNWIVGYGDPSRKSPNDVGGVVPQRVKVRSAGKVISASLGIVFGVVGNPRDNSGELVVNGCYMSFYATS
jgi:hypothetical protein